MADSSLGRISARLFRFRHDESGQALTETAITLPVYILIIFGVFFFGETYNLKIKVTQSARYAATLYARGYELDKVPQKVLSGCFHQYKASQLEVFHNSGGAEVKDNMSGGNSSVGDEVYDLITGLFLPVITQADVTVHYANPLWKTNVEPFAKEQYQVKGRFIYEANPWAYEEIEDENWFTTYLTMLMPGVGGLAIKELGKLLGDVF